MDIASSKAVLEQAPSSPRAAGRARVLASTLDALAQMAGVDASPRGGGDTLAPEWHACWLV